jgi:hypothetical protein
MSKVDALQEEVGQSLVKERIYILDVKYIWIKQLFYICNLRIVTAQSALVFLCHSLVILRTHTHTNFTCFLLSPM